MNESRGLPVTRLRRLWTVNAVFSGLCAVGFLAGGEALARRLGVPREELVRIAVALFVFVSLLEVAIWRIATLKPWVVGLGWVLFALDALWVGATPFQVGAYAPAGRALFGGVTLIVALLGTLQLRELVALARARRRPAVAA